jgi:sulfite exporter TauE/SafE/copper chaperone CopZ
MSKTIKSCTYSVSGTHCHACEILIEKEIKAMPGVKSVEASTNTATVTIKYNNGHKPDIALLNKIFKDSGYVFSAGESVTESKFKPDIFTSLLIVMGILGGFFLLGKIGIFSTFNVNTNSFYPAFFVFGLLAGFSTCAALVGGIILSLSKQWQSLYSSKDSTFARLQPTLIFNLGRLVLFSLFGGLLGYFGSFFHLSLTLGAVIAIIVSVIMFILALQMLNIKWANAISFALPKSLTGSIADETHFKGRLMPFVMGGLTFFLPCGFTLTAQSLALASGSIFGGALIMFSFALGTFVPLLLIGYSSAVTNKNPRTAAYFSQVAGILVLLFSLYNISAQMTVLGVNFIPSTTTSKVSTVSVVGGKQIIKMDASTSGYTPNTFTIKAGLPTRWEITDKGTSGCTNAVISRTLFEGPINLVPGTTSVREFTAPTTPGTYRFSCWMGMISGSIEVIN